MFWTWSRRSQLIRSTCQDILCASKTYLFYCCLIAYEGLTFTLDFPINTPRQAHAWEHSHQGSSQTSSVLSALSWLLFQVFGYFVFSKVSHLIESEFQPSSAGLLSMCLNLWITTGLPQWINELAWLWTNYYDCVDFAVNVWITNKALWSEPSTLCSRDDI